MLTEVNNSLGRRIRYIYTGSAQNFRWSGIDNGLSGGDARATTIAATGGLETITSITDAAGAQTRFSTAVIAGETRLTEIYDANDATTPSLRYTYDTLGRVSEARDAVALQGPQSPPRNPYLFRIAPAARGEREDPLGGRFAVLSNIFNATGVRSSRYIDELGRTTNSELDGRGRVVKTIYPELDQERLVYDSRNRVTQLRRVAKPGAGLVDIVVNATWNDTWNKPATITDARGCRTDFAYLASGLGAGQMLSATRPAISGSAPCTTGARPVYGFTYGAFGRVATSTDPTGLVVSNAYDAVSGNLTSSTLDPGASPHANAVTAFTYDGIGDVLTSADPRGNSTSTNYDAMRRPTLVRNHNGGAAATLLAGARTNYNLLGQVTSTEGGTAFSGSAVTTWVTRETRTYTFTGQVATVANGAGNVTTNAYEALDRVLTVTDPVGRITRNEYDLAGQLTRVIRADGTPLQQDYARYTYSLNGQRLSVRDANDNRSAYVYDGFDRLCRLYFPVQTLGANAANTGGIAESALTCSGAGSSPDYEGYSYDANSNRTSLRLRSAQSIAFTFDNLNRENFKDIPSSTTADVNTGYDLAGRRLFARFSTASSDAVSTACTTNNPGMDFCYDTAGRLISETTYGRRMQFQYDGASNRSRVSWPDAFFVQYAYDGLNRVDQIGENGVFTGAQLLGDYAYDALSRRAGLTRGNGAATIYAYDTASRLTALGHDLGGTADDQTFGFGFTPASQLASRSAANDNYNWTAPSVTRSYTRNGLNQYTNVSGTAFTHDTRGNLTGDGARTFTYDLENRLLTVAGSASMSLSYDPLGRLRQTVAGAATTQFLYDGDRLSAEYTTGGTVLRRYVFGPGVDEPLVWYEGAGTSDRRHLIADHQGSVMAENGAATVRYAYGPYGEPGTWTGARFRYTGQAALPEVQLYHYKARVYDPLLGRFLQTDPVGYESDLNLYGYVHADPVNRVDPSGLSDLNLFNPEEGAYAAADAFDAPGFFTITGHAGPSGLRDDRTTARGPMLNADRLLSAARDAGLQEGQRILLAGCNCASDRFAQRLSNLSGSEVYAANGFVMYPSTNDRDPTDDRPAYRPGDSVRVRVMEDRSGSGEERGFVRFTPNGQGTSGPTIRSITVNPTTGMATARYGPETGTRIGRTVTACVDKDKCGP